MATRVTKPNFSERSALVRYVSEENRLKGRRPAVATFLPDPPSNTPEKDYLSVNSLEVESITIIATYHRQKWQSGNGKVALIPNPIDQNPWAHWRSPMDMMRQG